MPETGASPMPPGFRSFEFDLPTALLDQLVMVFDGMEQGQLIPKVAFQVPNAQGVYQLFHNGRLVYIGKTDGQAGLRQRLSRHAWTIRSRQNLAPSDMSFKAIEVLVFSAMDLETALIARYRARHCSPAWNGSGFGSNDPGRRRDTTALREDGFDANYPIDIDVPLNVKWKSDAVTALDALAWLAENVPYTVRYERTGEALARLRDTWVRLTGEASLREIINAVCAALPPGWQATRLPGRVIVYQEAVDSYPGAEVIARS